MAIKGRDFKFSQFVSINIDTMYTNIEGNLTYFGLIQGVAPLLFGKPGWSKNLGPG